MLGVIVLTLLMSRVQPQPDTSGTEASFQLPPAALSDDTKSTLHVDEAFCLVMSMSSPEIINARFEITPNYYLYKSKIKLVGLDQTELANANLPDGKSKQDQYFGKSQIFDKSFSFSIPVQRSANGSVRVSATYQGCQNEGICYPPVTKTFSVKVAGTQ